MTSPQPMCVSSPPPKVRTQSPPATQQASVLFALRPSRRALAVGDDKLPALPPPQIPSCLSKYPPRSHCEWHSDSKCDRGCACVCPYVCVWLAIAGFWQEVNNRNTHFRLIGTSPQCQRGAVWWCWISSKCFCQNFYVRGNFVHTLLRSSCEEEPTDLAFMSPCDSKSCWVNEAVSPVACQVPNLIPLVLVKTFSFWM